MIDGSEKRNRQLAFELQNSHACEKRSKSGSNCVLTMTLILISLLSLLSFSKIYSFLCFSRLEIFIPIQATEYVPSFQSRISCSIPRSFSSHVRSRILVRTWPFAEEWVLWKKKILQALSFLLICDLHVFTSFSRKIFPCAFTLCFKHTEFTGSKDPATQE